MSRTARTDTYATMLLSALGLSPLLGCGGAVTAPMEGEPDGGRGNTGGLATGAGGSAGGNQGGSGNAGSATNTAGGGSGSGQGGSSVGPTFPCSNPAPIGTTGYIACEEGHVHRVAKGTCPYVVRPGDKDRVTGSNDSCSEDADCTAQAYGACDSFQAGRRCTYGCATDDDCQPGTICRCGPSHGTCVAATCTIDADCGAQLCTEHHSPVGCGTPMFSCQTPGDRCRYTGECGSSAQVCAATPEGRRCVTTCVVGRPFLIANIAHVAPRVDGSGWAAIRAFDEGHRTTEAAHALGEAWTDVALMEHASIAAFARFTLQLMSLGAPVELIERSNAAMADETRHARLAFALASQFSGRDVDPGALDIHGALTEATLEDILVGTIREGCIGETIAAMRAAEALEHAVAPAVRDTLAQIAHDEAQHAELAWRFVRWALARHGDAARHIVQRELDAARTVPVTAVPEPSEADRALLAGGILPDWLGSVIHNEVVVGVVQVCARALLGEGNQHAQRAA